MHKSGTKKVRDAAQNICKFFKNPGTHFYTHHATPRTLCALARVIPLLTRKIAGHGVNRFAGSVRAADW